MYVYIAGPIRLGDPAKNVRNAMDVADVLISQGHSPYLPHLTHFWDIANPRPLDDWLTLDKAWLRRCDCVLRIPGESEGADAEVAYAQGRGMTVYWNIQDIPKGP